MEFVDAVRARRMVRAYQPDRPVPRETIDAILALARRAPSAGHSQGWHFLVLDDPGSVEAYWVATGGVSDDSWLRRLRTAPALIVVLSDKDVYLDRYAEPDKGWTDRSEDNWPIPYWDTDAAMAAMIALLAIVDRDLGACFFGVPGDEWPGLRSAFDLPERMRPVGVISLGYPADDVRSPSLKRGFRDVTSVVSYGRYGITN